MKKYFSDSRKNKAALLLASMAPDMVEDITALVLSRGHNLLNDLAGADGPPRPLAIFSRTFINDEDFEDTFLGFSTVVLAQLRTVGSDNDFYEETLKNAFGLPPQMAQALAKKVETYDALGGAPDADTRGYLAKIQEGLAETIRRSANWVPSVLQLPFENDQDQKYDIDRLYEFKLLGQVVDDLSSRARLMGAQAAIARTMNLFLAKVNATNAAAAEGGDLEEGDAEEIIMGDIIDVLQEAGKGDVNPVVWGGLAPLASMGRSNSKAIAHATIKTAGLSNKPGEHGLVKNNALRNAVDKIRSGNVPPAVKIALAAAGGAGALKVASSLVKKYKDAKHVGDVMDDLTNKYTPELAAAMMSGDVAEVVRQVNDLGGDVMSTGDAELDEQIIGDVLDELTESGDADYGDAEIGGIIKRVRINSAIRKGQRREHRHAKKVQKVQQKSAENRALLEARKYKQPRYLKPQDTELPPEDEELSDDFQDQGFGDEDNMAGFERM